QLEPRLKARLREFVPKTNLIRAFEQTWAQFAMNPHRCRDNRMADFLCRELVNWSRYHEKSSPRRALRSTRRRAPKMFDITKTATLSVTLCSYLCDLRGFSSCPWW